MSISNLFQDNVYKLFSSKIDAKEINTSSYKYKGADFFKTSDKISVPYTPEYGAAGNIDIICSLVGKTITVYMYENTFIQTDANTGTTYTIQLPAGYRPALGNSGVFYNVLTDSAVPPNISERRTGSYNLEVATGIITFEPADGAATTDGVNKRRTTPAQCITLLASA